jgi:hypothetical protein
MVVGGSDKKIEARDQKDVDVAKVLAKTELLWPGNGLNDCEPELWGKMKRRLESR